MNSSHHHLFLIPSIPNHLQGAFEIHYCNKSNCNVTLTLGLQAVIQLTRTAESSKGTAKNTYAQCDQYPTQLVSGTDISSSKWNLALQLDFKLISLSCKIIEVLSADFVSGCKSLNPQQAIQRSTSQGEIGILKSERMIPVPKGRIQPRYTSVWAGGVKEHATPVFIR